MTTKTNAKYDFIYVITKCFKAFFKNSKGYLFLTILVSASVGAATAGATWIKQLFFDAVATTAANAGSTDKIFYLGITLILFLVFMLGVTTLTELLTDNLQIKLFGYLGLDMHKKAAKVEPIEYENPEKLDEINKAFKGAESASFIFSNVINIGTYYLPYFVFMGLYLVHLRPLLFIGILFAFAPCLFGHVVRTHYYTNLEHTQAPIRRKSMYYERCIVDREYFKETRLLGGFWFFRTLYEAALILLAKKAWETGKKTELLELGIRMVNLAGYLGVVYLMFYYLMKGELSAGAFAAIFSSVDQIFVFMEMAMGWRLGDISEGLGPSYNYFKFMTLPEEQGKEVNIQNFDIVFKDVSFRYPNAAQNSLSHINFTIHNSETVAIVGENGAGKSTLVKLILGIYKPTSGDVLIGGHNTKEISQSSIYHSMSAVFQNFQKYKVDVETNVKISDMTEPFSKEKMHAAAIRADLDLNDRSFTSGEKTMLSREFGGIDLSGGQWQRLALARGFFRDHRLIVLDEPTAAIDPIEETKVYKKFAEASKGKTSIIVTHRLGSAKIAQKIMVLDQGSIVDYATHDELVNNGGKYAQMYEAQAKWYVLH